jgi:hypothetical protein
MNIWPRKEQSLDISGEAPYLPRDLDERLPPDLVQRLRGEGVAYSYAPMRTAQIIADDIAHLRSELSAARMLVAQGEAKEAELVAELQTRIDEETLAHRAECEAKLAELEKLRPSTGESSEGNQT